MTGRYVEKARGRPWHGVSGSKGAKTGGSCREVHDQEQGSYWTCLGKLRVF